MINKSPGKIVLAFIFVTAYSICAFENDISLNVKSQTAVLHPNSSMIFYSHAKELFRKKAVAKIETRQDPIIYPIMVVVDLVLSGIATALDFFLSFQKQAIQDKIKEIVDYLDDNFKFVKVELNKVHEMIKLRGREHFSKAENAIACAIDDIAIGNEIDIEVRAVNVYTQILVMLNGLLGTAIVFPDLLEILRLRAKVS